MARSEPEKTGRIIFGGSFNPVHIGHMRLAIETLSLMSGLADRVEFLPSAAPPHKPRQPMLPFVLRSRLIRAAIKGRDGFFCNEIEARLPAPSYTWETLAALAAELGPENLYFLLGSKDFELLPEWRNGLRLPELCNLAVAPRGDYGKENFAEKTLEFWPDRGEIAPGPKNGCLAEQSWRSALATGTSVYLLPLPYLDISATRIRKLWLRGANLDYLAPGPVLEILDEERETTTACWQEKKC